MQLYKNVYDNRLKYTKNTDSFLLGVHSLCHQLSEVREALFEKRQFPTLKRALLFVFKQFKKHSCSQQNS